MSTQEFLVRLTAPDGAWTLGPGTHLIGRSSRCDLTLESDPRVSKRHAQLTVAGRSIIVRDLDSRNGTYVDQQRIVGEHPLSAGATLTIGRRELAVSLVSWVDAPPKTKAKSSDRSEAGESWYRNMLASLPDSGEVSDHIEALTNANTTRDPPRAVRVAGWAVVLASTTHNGRWLDTVWTIYHRQSVLITAEQLAEVEHIIEGTRSATLQPLERYIVDVVTPIAKTDADAERTLRALKLIHAIMLDRTQYSAGPHSLRTRRPS